MKIEADTDNSKGVANDEDEHSNDGFFPAAVNLLMIFRNRQEAITEITKPMSNPKASWAELVLI